MWRNVFQDQRFERTIKLVTDIIPQARPPCQSDVNRATLALKKFLHESWPTHFDIFVDRFSVTSNNVANCGKLWALYRHKLIKSDRIIGSYLCQSLNCRDCGPIRASKEFYNLAIKLMDLKDVYLAYHVTNNKEEFEDLTTRLKQRAKRHKANYCRVARTFGDTFIIADKDLSGSQPPYFAKVNVNIAIAFLAASLIVPGIATKGIAQSAGWQLREKGQYKKIIGASKDKLEWAVRELEHIKGYLSDDEYEGLYCKRLTLSDDEFNKVLNLVIMQKGYTVMLGGRINAKMSPFSPQLPH